MHFACHIAAFLTTLPEVLYTHTVEPVFYYAICWPVMSLYATPATCTGLCYESKRRHGPGEDILGRGRERLCNLRFKLTPVLFYILFSMLSVCIRKILYIDESGQISLFH